MYKNWFGVVQVDHGRDKLVVEGAEGRIRHECVHVYSAREEATCEVAGENGQLASAIRKLVRIPERTVTGILFREGAWTRAGKVVRFQVRASTPARSLRWVRRESVHRGS